MKYKQDRFGINISRSIKEHEAYLQEHGAWFDDPANTAAAVTPSAAAVPDIAATPGAAAVLDDQSSRLLEYHLRKIEWLQHERLIHLLVTLVFAVLLLFLYGLALFREGDLLVLLLVLLVIPVLVAYVIHYFRLENAVQRWCHIGDRMYRRFIEGNRES